MRRDPTLVRDIAHLFLLALVCSFAPAAVWFGEDQPPRVYQAPPTMAVMTPSAMVAQRDMDADVLALVAWSEDVRAPEAVMWTIVNRARARGTSVLEEARRPEQYHGVRGDRDPRAWRRARRDRAELARFRRLAGLILRGELADPTRGATHFHAVGSKEPTWAPPPRAWVVRGGSAFYRVRPVSR